MKNTNSKKHSETKQKTHPYENLDAKSEISVHSAKSIRSSKSAKGIKNASSRLNFKNDSAGGDKKDPKTKPEEDCGPYCCWCQNCPMRYTLIPPKLRHDLLCGNTNKLVPPIVSNKAAKETIRSTSEKNKTLTRDPPAKSVASVKSVKASARAASPAKSIVSVKDVKESARSLSPAKSVKSIKSVKSEKSIKEETPKGAGDKAVIKLVQLRASVLTYCDCIKKNGLQDECPNFVCRKDVYA